VSFCICLGEAIYFTPQFPILSTLSRFPLRIQLSRFKRFNDILDRIEPKVLAALGCLLHGLLETAARKQRVFTGSFVPFARHPPQPLDVVLESRECAVAEWRALKLAFTSDQRVSLREPNNVDLVVTVSLLAGIDDRVARIECSQGETAKAIRMNTSGACTLGYRTLEYHTLEYRNSGSRYPVLRRMLRIPASYTASRK
jgi:hypothetical protein